MADLASLDLPRIVLVTCGKGKAAGQGVDPAVLCKQAVGGSSPLVSTEETLVDALLVPALVA